MSPDRRLMTVVGDNLDGLLVDSQSGKVQQVLHLKFFLSQWNWYLYFSQRGIMLLSRQAGV